jgi:hypothetical protein
MKEFRDYIINNYNCMSSDYKDYFLTNINSKLLSEIVILFDDEKTMMINILKNELFK